MTSGTSLITATIVLSVAIAAAGAESSFHTTGTLELLLYLPPAGYAPAEKVSLLPPNAASYGIDVKSQLRWGRMFLVFDPLVLLGDSGVSGKPTYNVVPTTALMRYGIGLQMNDRIQLGLNHGEGFDIAGPPTHASMWNSLSMRARRQRSTDFLEAHVYLPHGEYDPNPAVPFTDRIVARYSLELAITVPTPEARRPFAFTEPFFLFGDSRPQIAYSWSAKPLAVRLNYGIGIPLARETQLRVTRGEWRDLGGYRRGRRQLWHGVSARYRW